MCLFLVTPAAGASITIDVDQVSQIAYCVDVYRAMQTRNAAHPTSCANTDLSVFCQTERLVDKVISDKLQRFEGYIIARLVESEDLIFPITAARDAGERDDSSCDTEQVEYGKALIWKKRSACPVETDEYYKCLEPGESPGPCRRALACGKRELPY
jgi:hypothetical protein